jgi:large subunit ribosomal protein L24
MITANFSQIHWKTPRGKPQYLPRTVERKKYRFTMNRPWTGQFRQQNMPGTIRKKVFLEPIENWSYFRGDRVEVLVGKDKGKQGIVTQVIPERNWVVVEGLNCHYRRVGQDKEYPGVTIKSEAPLLVTDQIALVDPADLLSTKFEWRYTEEGEKVRVSLRTGKIIPVPKAGEETIDYKTKGTYIEREKDTSGSVASEITFKPSLQTFEMEIMREMGIEEERVPKKSYWY